MQKLTVILAICIMFSPPVTLLAQQHEPSLYYQQRFELVVHLADRFPKDHPGSGVINFLREHAVQALETGKAPKIIQIDLNKPNSEPH